MHVVLETKRKNPRDHLFQLPGCIGPKRVSRVLGSCFLVLDLFQNSSPSLPLTKGLVCPRGSAVCPGRVTSPLRPPAATPPPMLWSPGPQSGRTLWDFHEPLHFPSTHDLGAYALEDFVTIFPTRLACSPRSGSSCRAELKHCLG